MSSKPEIMRTSKQNWVTRRTEGHTDWSFGFWRELFQNETDAGAKRIDITISDAPGKGSFGRDPNVDDVVRVTFQGDGSGMDERVLRDVFLSPGETTKKGGEFQGGFGTARIMLCFSQVRYGVRTQDWIVEGDGSEYTCTSVPEAIADKREELAAAMAQGRDEVAAQLRADIDALAAEGNRLDGCRFEIDIDPRESPYRSRNVDRDKLSAKLGEYLSLSQLPCKVFVNGEEASAKAARGPAKRKLVATGPDGAEVEFATVHTSQGDRAMHKGKVVVRSGGAAMYTENVSAKDQVIVEIDPSLSRQVLTDNRDGMKEPYRTALQAFLRELAVDTRSALESKDKRKHIKIEGDKGAILALPALPAVDVGAEGAIVEMPGRVKARYTTREDYELHGFGGASKEVVDVLLEAVNQGDDTFLRKLGGADYQRVHEISRFTSAVQTGRGTEALSELGPVTGALVAATLLARADEAGKAVRQMEAVRLSDMHDVHIQVDDIGDDEKLKQAVRRYTPSYWRKEGQHLAGRGMQAHMLLSAWTACCHEAVDTLLALRPDVARADPLSFSTGFYFGKSTERWNGQKYVQSRTAAQHQEREGVHLLLLNPVTEVGQPAFDLTKTRRDNGSDQVMGIQDLEALACHEVAHIMLSSHDEDFSTLMTDIGSMFNRTRAHERMRDAVDAVRAVYGKGKTVIQSMDGGAQVAVLEAEEEPAPREGRRREPRPSEVLLAHAAPITTMVAGAASADENSHLPLDTLKAVVSASVTVDGDGVVGVDCNSLQSMETKLSAMVDHGWDLGSLELPPLAELRDMDAPDSAADATGLDLGSLDLPPADHLPEFGAAALPASAGLSIDLAALSLPDAADLPEFGRDEPVSVSPPATVTPVVGERGRKRAAAAPARPVVVPESPAAVSLPGGQEAALEALRQFSGSLSSLGSIPSPKTRESVVVRQAAPVPALVGDEFEMDGFDAPAGPGRF